MCDDSNLKTRLKELKAKLDRLMDSDASKEEIYAASIELDDCINDYIKKYGHGNA